MKYNIHNIWKGNAPPEESRDTRLEWREQSIVQNVFPHLGGNVRRTKGVTRSSKLEACNFFNGSPLLNMRDGPRGRAPANSYAMANGLVTLNKQKSSVPLCGFSVNSVVKHKINHKERGEDTENTENYTLNPTKAFRDYCTVYVRLQEENFEKD